MSNKKYGRNYLKRYRLLFGYSQGEIARKLGLNSTTLISRWELGEAYPDLKNAMKLSCIYKTLVDQLFPELRNRVIKEMSCKNRKNLKDMGGP